MRHVVMYSGGIGSWAAARRVADKYGTDNLSLLFTDTLCEHPDTYRFLVESAANVLRRSGALDGIVELAAGVPREQENERQMQAHLNADVTILRDRAGGETQPLSLYRLRRRIEGGIQPDLFDIGGCGCFLDDQEAA